MKTDLGLNTVSSPTTSTLERLVKIDEDSRKNVLSLKRRSIQFPKHTKKAQKTTPCLV
jgi:hypothetical protein